jgi:hypothetical protein
VSTIIAPAVNSIGVDKRRPFQFMAVFFGALGCHMRRAFRTVSDLIERRFAEFADVPYQNPFSRQQWKELWETEAKKTAPSRYAGCPLAGGAGQVGRSVFGEGAD